MIRHDQLFKDLLRAFFADFLRLTDPGSAARFDLARLRFLDTETVTDVPKGHRRQLDLLADVPFQHPAAAGAERGLVHVEIEARARRDIGRRLARYAMQICLRHDQPLLTVLLTLRGGRPGLRAVTVAVTRMVPETLRFRYVALFLERSRPADYLARPEPLAWALAALMRPEGSRAVHKLACLKPIAAAKGLDEARRSLLVNCVTTYLELNGEEAAEYEALEAAEENREVREMAMTWADKLMAQGRKVGRTEGRAEGAREMVLLLLGQRFGPLPEEARRRVEAISSPTALARLAKKALGARSLDEMGLA